MTSHRKADAKMCPWMGRGRTVAEHWSKGSQKVNSQDLWERSGGREKEAAPDGVPLLPMRSTALGPERLPSLSRAAAHRDWQQAGEPAHNAPLPAGRASLTISQEPNFLITPDGASVPFCNLHV